MLMYNIAIVTIYGNWNFGNKLQNYAVQRYFEQSGNRVTTIKYRKQLRHIAFMNIIHFTILRKMIHLMLYYTKFETQRRKKLSTIEERKNTLLFYYCGLSVLEKNQLWQKIVKIEV